MAPTSGMPWIKLWTDMLDDPKLGAIDPTIKWRFVELCLMAGECDSEGYLVNGNDALTIENIAWRLRANPAQLGAALEVLQGVGLIAQDPDGFRFVVNFEKRQGRSQSAKRKQWRERKQRQRDKDCDSQKDSTESPENVTRDSRVTHGTREEKRREDTEERRGDNAANAAPPPPAPPKEAKKPARKKQPPLTEGQRCFLEPFGAKRYKTIAQRAAVLEMEKEHGTSKLLEAATWAAERGMTVGAAVGACRSALPKWGQPKNKGSPAAPEPKGFTAIRAMMEKEGMTDGQQS